MEMSQPFFQTFLSLWNSYRKQEPLKQQLRQYQLWTKREPGACYVFAVIIIVLNKY